jgi:hypothetical protein
LKSRASNAITRGCSSPMSGRAISTLFASGIIFKRAFSDWTSFNSFGDP